MITLEEHIVRTRDRMDAAYAWLNTYWGLRLVDATAIALIIAIILFPNMVR